MPERCTALLAVGFAVLLSACGTWKQSRLLEPTRHGMEQIGPRVYAAKGVPEGKRRELLDAYDKARARMKVFYGGTVTDAVVLGCADRDCIRAFGGHGDGFAAFEVTPAVLVWTKVFGAGEIAHEWSHLELHARIGSSGARRTIPNWFHEGLATVVGDIPRHSEAVYQEALASRFPIPPLSELRTGKQWGAAFAKYPNPRGLNVAYATAGHEVRAWLRRVGRQGLFDLIDAVKSGEGFDAAYVRIDERAANR